MKPIVSILFIVVCSFASSVFAESVDMGGMVLGPGAISCGKFLADTKDVSGEVQYFQWTLGFISGVNHVKGQSVGAGTDRFALLKQLDNYCREHPLEMFVDAVLDLQKKLSIRAFK